MHVPAKTDYEYPSPLKGYENHPALPDEKASDGKSYINPPAGNPSPSYDKFEDPIDNGIRGGFDIHIYYDINNHKETQYAQDLWKRIRYEFPELRTYRIWDKPIGPHPLPMFEVNLFSPTQFGAFIAWLVIWRGPLSVLVHPNTDDEVRDHAVNAVWLGDKVDLDFGIFEKIKEGKNGV